MLSLGVAHGTLLAGLSRRAVDGLEHAEAPLELAYAVDGLAQRELVLEAHFLVVLARHELEFVVHPSHGSVPCEAFGLFAEHVLAWGYEHARCQRTRYFFAVCRIQLQIVEHCDHVRITCGSGNCPWLCLCCALVYV